MARTYRMEPVDIGRSARGMVRIYGAAAEKEAVACAKKFEKSNDLQGVETWKAIAKEIRLVVQETAVIPYCVSGISADRPASEVLPLHKQ